VGHSARQTGRPVVSRACSNENCDKAHLDDQDVVALYGPRPRHTRGNGSAFLRRSERVARNSSNGTEDMNDELRKIRMEAERNMLHKLQDREPGWIAKSVKTRRGGQSQASHDDSHVVQ
jgi:hypothetical protein